MFRGTHWAQVFTNVLSGHADEGLACLKAMAAPLKTIPGTLSGHAVSRRLESLLREVSGKAGSAVEAPLEYAIRFIVLLVEKNHFRDIDLIIQHIEERIDMDKGILRVNIESAFVMDSAFTEALQRRIIEKSGAAQVTMQTVIMPELLGGLRLRIGSFYIDASLKGQMKTMQAELEAAILSVSGGGE